MNIRTVTGFFALGAAVLALAHCSSGDSASDTDGSATEDSGTTALADANDTADSGSTTSDDASASDDSSAMNDGATNTDDSSATGAAWTGSANYKPDFATGSMKSELNLVLGNVSNACSILATGAKKANSKGIHFEIERTNAGKNVVWTPGTLIGGMDNTDPNGDVTKVSIKGANNYDGTCTATSPGSPMSGSVTITAVSAGSMTGTYSITFSGGTFGGTFSATPCGQTSDAGVGTCVP